MTVHRGEIYRYRPGVSTRLLAIIFSISERCIRSGVVSAINVAENDAKNHGIDLAAVAGDEIIMR
jgi:hypothetical protein